MNKVTRGHLLSGLAMLIIAALLLAVQLGSSMANVQLPCIPPYPGATVVESVTYGSPTLNDGELARTEMEFNVQPGTWEGLGTYRGFTTTYPSEYKEFGRIMEEYGWINAGSRSYCPEYRWWNSGNPETHWPDFESKKGWTLDIIGRQVQPGIVRLTFTVTQGFARCSPH
ncbi:MAG: hypothetical protein ABI670_08990 [Chloroflexota bacterium]